MVPSFALYHINNTNSRIW